MKIYTEQINTHHHFDKRQENTHEVLVQNFMKLSNINNNKYCRQSDKNTKCVDNDTHNEFLQRINTTLKNLKIANSDSKKNSQNSCDDEEFEFMDEDIPDEWDSPEGMMALFPKNYFETCGDLNQLNNQDNYPTNADSTHLVLCANNIQNNPSTNVVASHINKNNNKNVPIKESSSINMTFGEIPSTNFNKIKKLDTKCISTTSICSSVFDHVSPPIANNEFLTMDTIEFRSNKTDSEKAWGTESKSSGSKNSSDKDFLEKKTDSLYNENPYYNNAYYYDLGEGTITSEQFYNAMKNYGDSSLPLSKFKNYDKTTAQIIKNSNKK